VLDREMRYILVSERWLDDFRCPDRNIIGKCHYDVFPDIPERWKEVHRRCLAGATERSEEDYFPRADGAVDWTKWEIRPWYDDRGEIGGIVIFGENITTRKHAENALKESNERLAQADRRKNEFLAMLGHELRNPLAAIQLAVDTLCRRPDADAALQKVSDLLRRQTSQLVRMVDDLLEVSRVTSGKLRLKKERTYVMSVVSQAVETTRPLVESKELQLSVVMPPEQIALEGDPARLAQALVNVLSNAAKYTPTGGRISLSAVREAGHVVFRVKDTGIGIAPDMLDPIFELFVQSDRALDRAQGGLGLGLPLVRRIAEMHGGSVQALSDGLGKGSEFVIRIPAGSAERTKAPQAVPPPTPRPSHRRILLVDDNQDLAQAFAAVLKGSGHDVRIAYDGPSGLQAAEEFRPEVLFLDIGLPLLDGYEVARRLRRLPGLETITLIALSGYGEPEDRQQSKEAGFDLHLVKPTDLGRIEQVLATLPGPATAPR
jgi:PAS domain S-box-containing protein